MVLSFATPDATKGFFQQNPIDPSKIKHFDGLTLSALGVGTYLGACDDTTDQLMVQTLLEAAGLGVNCFDTAINYRGGRSEKVIAKVVIELEKRGISRESLLIATKGGFFSSAEEIATVLEKGIVLPKDLIAESHCMTPSYLNYAIQGSLRNLQLETIDLYYLHNPEIELFEVGEAEFYRRLEAAFRQLEENVAQGKIRRYGIATWNGFRQKIGAKGTLSLEKIVSCAKRAAGSDEHHLKAIQLPYNCIMLEVLKVKNQEDGRTVLTAARDFGIEVMVSAPLMQGQVKNLPRRIFEKIPPAPTFALQALEFVVATEGICSAFVGTKKIEHLQEDAQVLKSPIWTQEMWIAACITLGLDPSILTEQSQNEK